MSKLFDKVKGATGSESEKAVIEATLHTAREPPPEKYVRRLVLGSANGENSLIAAALKKRLDELDWKIVLKALIVTHVLTREGDLQFTAEMLVYADKFRYLNRFADLSSGVAHTQSTFVRPYSQYIGARLRTFSEFRIDYERDPPGTKSMSVNVAIDKYPVFGAQMDTLLACKAEAATANNVLIFNALQLLVRDSMRLYQVMTMVVSRLIDEFPRQSKENMQKILDIYRTFISHTEGLNSFYDGLRSQIAECPSNLKRPPTSLKSLEDYMNNPSAHQQHDDAPPLEKLNLGSVGQPLQVHHTGVFAGAQPIYTGANPVINQPPMGAAHQHTQYAPAGAGGAPQYPAAVVRQQSAAQMGANPFAAQPGGASPAYPAAVSSPTQPVYNHQQLFALPTSQPQNQPQPQAQPNPFAASGVSYASPVPSPAQPKYPTPPSHASPPTQTSYLPPQSYASPPPAQNYSNPFAVPAAKPAPASPPQQPANLMAIASHLQNPPPPQSQPTQWSPQPAAQQAPNSPFAPVAPQYGASAAPVQPTQPTSPSAPSANMQAQFSAAAGQQPMLYYRLPTGEFVAVPASALQGMQLSAAPPQGAAAAPSVNPFGQQ